MECGDIPVKRIGNMGIRKFVALIDPRNDGVA